MEHYDYLIVGSGLYGATYAYRARQAGMRCLVIDKRNHVGGNVYCERVKGINVHKYGAHIFHTSDRNVWEFVNRLVPFNRYTNSPMAYYKGSFYNLPFNMNTFSEMWGVTTPAEAQAIIEKQKAEAMNRMLAKGVTTPRNLEEQALVLVGNDIYEKLIKGYTEKQWGRRCADLPAFIIKRLPVRWVYDNNYFNYLYMGIANMNKVIELNTDEATAANNSAYGANCNQIAAAKIMKVWMTDIITDTWGNVPYSDVAKLEKEGLLYCKYDDQKDIYVSSLRLGACGIHNLDVLFYVLLAFAISFASIMI